MRLKIKLQRQWTLFLVPFCHVDIGFSNTQADVLKLHKLNLDGKTNHRGEKTGVLDLIEQTANYPDDARFKFTSECSWPVYEFLNDKEISDARKEKLAEHMKSGDIETCAFLINHTNKFMGPEMLVRSTSFACEFIEQRYGVPVLSAMLNDVGDASGIVPALSSAGVNYFFYGPNSLHYDLPPLFYLKSPSGNGEKILTWVTPGMSAYGENTDFGLRPPPPRLPLFPHNPDAPLPDYEANIFQHLQWLENHGLPLEDAKKKKKWAEKHYGYPYDAYLIPYYPAHAGDNGHQDKTPCDIAKAWNEKHDNPKLKIATLSEFYRYIEAKHSAHIPERRVDFTGFWGEQIFFPMNHIEPEKLPKIREFERQIASSEKFYSFLKPFKNNMTPITENITDSFKKAILLTDHNPCPVPFSGNKHPANSSGISFTEEDIALWKQTKQEWLNDLSGTASAIEKSAMENLLSSIKFTDDATRILVMNPLSWNRTDAVTVDISTPDMNFQIFREGTNERVPFQNADSGKISFLARDIPAHGYCVYKIIHSEPSANARAEENEKILNRPPDAIIENSHYKLEIKQSGQNNERLSLHLEDRQTNHVIFHNEEAENFLRPLFLARRETLGSGILIPLPPFLAKEDGLKTLKISRISKGTVFTRIEMEGTFKEKHKIKTPLYLSLAAKIFHKFLEGSEDDARISLPETIKFSIVIYNEIKRINFFCEFSPVPNHLFEFVFPLSFNEKPADITVDSAYQNVSIHKDEARAIPLKKTAVNPFNFPFLWIQDVPPDNVFWNYAKFSFKNTDVYFSSRESGTLIFSDKNALKNKKSSAHSVYHLALGTTFFGNLLLGKKEKNAYTLSSMLTSAPHGNSSEAHEFPEQICLNYQYPLMTAVRETQKNETGFLPSSFSFISADKNNVSVTVFKESSDGKSFILRLYEFLGKNENVRIALNFNKAFSAFITTSSGEPLKEILADVKTSSFTVSMQPHELKTVKIQFHEGERNDDEPFRNFPCSPDAAQ